MVCGFSCHTSRQKSTKVLFIGPTIVDQNPFQLTTQIGQKLTDSKNTGIKLKQWNQPWFIYIACTETILGYLHHTKNTHLLLLNHPPLSDHVYMYKAFVFQNRYTLKVYFSYTLLHVWKNVLVDFLSTAYCIYWSWLTSFYGNTHAYWQVYNRTGHISTNKSCIMPCLDYMPCHNYIGHVPIPCLSQFFCTEILQIKSEVFVCILKVMWYIGQFGQCCLQHDRKFLYHCCSIYTSVWYTEHFLQCCLCNTIHNSRPKFTQR